MTQAQTVMQALLERYAAAVNANDSAAYRRLFAPDAIRVPPGNEPERGPDAIAKSEQGDYDQAKWSIRMRLIDAIPVGDRWVHGMVHVDASLVFRADGRRAEKRATKMFLMEKQGNEEWLIKRYMWNLKG